MIRWFTVLAGAVVGGGLVLGYLLHRKRIQLAARGELLRAQFETEEGQAEVTRQLAAMRTNLAAHAETVATRAADTHLGTYYGLTPARMQQIENLTRQLGAN